MFRYSNQMGARQIACISVVLKNLPNLPNLREKAVRRFNGSFFVTIQPTPN